MRAVRPSRIALVAWVVATACLMLQWSSINGYVIERLRQIGGLPEPFWIHSCGAVAFSIAVMLCSFITAYLFRSPITALIALVPLLIGSIWITAYAATLVIPQGQFNAPPEMIAQTAFGRITMIGVTALVGLWVLSFVAAWRRLTWPASTFADRAQIGFSSGAFRPPQGHASSKLVAAMVARRPSRVTALLWQQVRSIAWQLALLVLVALVGILLLGSRTWGAQAQGMLMCACSLLLIAPLTFYSDSVRKRCLFLHDRGISPTLIWLSRLFPTMVVTLVLLAVITAVAIYRDWVVQGGNASIRWDARYAVIFSAGFAAFALSQLVSQWSPRPTLAS